jgi:site-specific DNA recombinase
LNTAKTDTIKAVGYTRVSTDEQAREGVSLDNQRVKIETYCQLHDIELAGIVEDAGKSAKDLNRPGIQELQTLIKTRQINAVVVYKLDRLSRSVLDTLNLVELMRRNKVEFHAIVDNVDTGTAMGKFFFQLTAAYAEMERNLISERTRDALQHKIAKGERAGQIPYGWSLAPDGKTLVTNEKEQEIIALVRELHDEGYSYRAICRELEAKHYEPVGIKWHHQTINNILKKAA